MRNPGKRRNISVVVGAIALATLVLTLALHRGDSALGAWFTVVVISAHVTVFALVGLVVFQANHRMRVRLERGERMLAKWTLTAEQWRTFAADEVERKAAGRNNNFKVRPDRVDDGARVLIAENAIMIDDDFYHLGRMRGLQWLPDALPCLEYNMNTAGKSGSVKWNVRIPVPPDAEAQARAVWDYVHRPGQHAPPHVKATRFRRARAGGLVVAAVATPALVFTVNNLRRQEMPEFGLLALFVGLIGVPIGLFVSVLSHVMLRRVGAADDYPNQEQ
jgi:hypothetical protein